MSQLIDRDSVYDVIEAEIARLEPSSCPDTRITRTQMDNTLALKEGLEINPEREFTWGWCVTVGRTYEVKRFFYGNTIRQAVGRALKAVEEDAA